ncbi:MAG: hypothetical protein FJW81_09825 [Actinobacteria bacterium]|nr:hypothetical protein [Actinomycetota bacterium]
MAQTSEQQAPTTGLSDAVVEWRRETLERAGLDAERAEKIAASDADLHEAVRLIEQGCAPELLERILL